MSSLTLATWNVHRCKGRDGAVDAKRTARAIETELVPRAPDILALQEADDESARQAGLLDIPQVERATGLRRLSGHEWGAESHGFQGNVLFLSDRLWIRQVEAIDLPGVWPRGAIAIEFERPVLRLVATHLSLGQALRMVQMRTLAQFLARKPRLPTVLAGDLNEWRPWGGLALSRKVAGLDWSGPPRRTFPATLPLLPLDRVLVDRPGILDSVESIASKVIRDVSDHLPLVARLRPEATSG